MVSICLLMVALGADDAAESERLAYNNPGLVVDLGVGLWAYPLPCDYDGDGDNDLLVATPDKPSNGIYFFENAGGDEDMPVFKAGVRLSDAPRNLTISHHGSDWTIATTGEAFPDYKQTKLENPVDIPVAIPDGLGKTRAKQYYLLDYDGDGRRDVVMGIGIWQDYGWDDAWNEQGEWQNGPLRGHVYVALNNGDGYDEPYRLSVGDDALEVYGAPSPQFADWDGDGDLDLICGEFLDRLTFFENVGTREEPEWAEGKFIQDDGETLHLDLEMLQVTSLDWDKDGDTDIIVGKEDGRVVYLECTGEMVNGRPAFESPRYFEQEADNVKVGALSTPYGCDWDGDGDKDLIVGDTAGYLSFVENLDGGDPPKWAEPVYLEADGETIRIMAGPNGSIQGPAEAKWGYTVPNVADWNHDGLLDIVINSIWGKVLWYENVGEEGAPALAAAKPIRVDWEGETPKPAWTWWDPEPGTLVTQWRTTPLVRDLNGDGLNDLSILDTEGYLAFFERKRTDDGLILKPGVRMFKGADGEPLRLNERDAGGSGRRKLAFTDWDGDGDVDILANSTSTDLLRNTGDWTFENVGRIDARTLGGHSTCPSTVDWDQNGIPDLLNGAEDGFFYYMKNPRAK